ADAVAQAQAVEQALEQALCSVWLPVFDDGGIAAGHLHVGTRPALTRRARDAAVGCGQLGMAAGADRQIIAERPVIAVVAAVRPGLRPGRDFVLGIAGSAQGGGAVREDVGDGVVVGAFRRSMVERRARFQRQLVV